MLHEEVEKYINLSGDKEAWQNTSVSRIGGYLDGYDKGIEILDKIRAEIKELDIFYDNDYFSGNTDAMFKCNEVLQIIDKYKAESEE